MENKIYNLVYENWNGETPLPNMKKLYEKHTNFFIDSIGIVQHWINESKKENKFEIKRCKIEEVYENPNKKYQFMFGHYALRIEQLFSYKPPFSDVVLKCLRECPNFNFIFHSEHESDDEMGFELLNQYVKKEGINGKQIYVVNNNAKLLDYKKKFNSEINVHSLQFIPSSSTIVLQHLGGCDFISDKEGKFFMSFNKSPKNHRIGLLSMLRKNNLLNETNWSYVPNFKTPITIDSFGNILNDNDLNYLKNDIEYILNLDIKISDYEINKGWFSANKDMNLTGLPPWMRVPELLKNYESSYVNLTTESQYENYSNVIHITEKSFKPFYHYQFPLILASHNHLKVMKERYDLDFFEDIMNHDYDTVYDDRERFIIYFKEVLRVFKNKNNFIDFYKKNKERFLENKRKVDLITTQEGDYDFFEGLI